MDVSQDSPETGGWSLEQGLHADVPEERLAGQDHAAVSRLTEFESSPLALTDTPGTKSPGISVSTEAEIFQKSATRNSKELTAEQTVPRFRISPLLRP